MKTTHTGWIAWVILAALVIAPGALVVTAWAQGTPTPAAPSAPTPPAAPPTPAPSAAPAGGSGILTAVILVVGLLVLIGIAVKVFDLKRKREAEAVHLQAQISDALLREPAFFGLPIIPTAHVPRWRGSPAILEITGQVPTPAMREAVMRLVRDEAARIRPDVHIEDRLAVVPTMREVA